MSLEQKSKQIGELDKKRWLARYAILAVLFCILAIKFYMMLYVLDIVVGAYSFITTFVLFNILLITYTKYKDPYINADNLIHLYNSKPLVTIVVPVKNEEENIRRCIQSCIDSSYSSKEIIVVNDGSTDQTPRILDHMHKEHPDLHILHLSKSIGKKGAIEMATEIAKGEIYFFMDSDCNMAKDAVENAVKIFLSDRTIGAVTAHGRVRGAENGSTLKKLQDVWYDGQYRIIKGMESSFSSLTCSSGALTGFRRAGHVQPYMHAWAHDRFLGDEFKFATDRRLTAYVLGAKPPSDKKSDNNDDETRKADAYSYMSLLSTGDDDFESMKRSSDSDISIEDKSRYRWKLKYSPHVRVYIGPPETFPSLIRQQIRWRKSFIRSIFATGGVYWRRPFFAALLYFLQVGLKIIRPYVVFQSLILLPLLSNDYYSGIFYIVSVIFTGMIYGIDFRLRNPGSPLWLYRPLITILSTLVFTWLLVYAAITIKKTAWR